MTKLLTAPEKQRPKSGTEVTHEQRGQGGAERHGGWDVRFRG